MSFVLRMVQCKRFLGTVSYACPLQWPYHGWNKEQHFNDRQTAKPFVAHGMNGLFQNNPEPGKPNSQLHELLRRLAPMTHVCDTDESKALKRDVKDLMYSITDKLGQEGEVFTGCRFIEAGSMAEGTKVVKLGEFDYMVVLDALSNDELFQRSFKMDFNNAASVTIDVLDVALYEKMYSKVDLLTSTSSNRTTVTHNLQSIFVKNVSKAVRQVRCNEWSAITTERGLQSYDDPCMSKNVVTFHMLSHKHNVQVDIDISLCIPIVLADIREIQNEQNTLNIDHTEKPPIIDVLAHLMQRSNVEYFAVALDNIITCSDRLDVSFTVTMLEIARFRRYDLTNGRLKTYKLAKCIATLFLPRFYDPLKCISCCRGLVKSYHLKNIILYMMDFYTNDSHWSEERLSQRVLEVFYILRLCKDTVLTCRYLPITLHFDFHGYQKSPAYIRELFHTEHQEANLVITRWFDTIEKDTHRLNAVSDLEGLLLSLSQF